MYCLECTIGDLSCSFCLIFNFFQDVQWNSNILYNLEYINLDHFITIYLYHLRAHILSAFIRWKFSNVVDTVDKHCALKCFQCTQFQSQFHWLYFCHCSWHDTCSGLVTLTEKDGFYIGVWLYIYTLKTATQKYSNSHARSFFVAVTKQPKLSE